MTAVLSRRMAGWTPLLIILAGGLNACGSKPVEQKPAEAVEAKPETRYECPMHPDVNQAEPGKCPKCGMQLVVKD